MQNQLLILNRIVKVIDGRACGNKPGTIVKILSKPGRIVDQVTSITTKLYSDKLMDKVLCESITGPKANTLNNQQVCYEYLNDLMLATEHEKHQRQNLTIISKQNG